MKTIRFRAAQICALLITSVLLAQNASAECGPAPGGPTCGGSSVASVSTTGGPNVGAGNPINVITGNKYQRENDMPPLPGVLGLEIVRHYNSAYSKPGNPNGPFGRGWRLSYETEVFHNDGRIQVLQADGGRVIFDRDPKEPGLCSTINPANGAMELEEKPNGRHEYTWTWTNGRKLHFNTSGKLDRITAPTGENVRLLYNSANLLVRVVDPQNRSLNLVYFNRKTPGRFSGVQFIESPVGRFGYEYGSAKPEKSDLIDKAQLLANMVRVHSPTGNVSRFYHHENPRMPWLLTGISVETMGSDNKAVATRIATYGYDSDGRANLSMRTGGVDKVALDTSVAGKTVLTNSLGQKTTYTHSTIGGEHRLLEVRGVGCASCGAANVRYGYSKTGQLVETTTLTENGEPTATTRTELDTRGRTVSVSKTLYQKGKREPNQLQVRYEYHGDSFSPVLIARPSVVPGKEALTRIAYNQSGQPIHVSESGWVPSLGGTHVAGEIKRATRYTYATINGWSMLAKMDGPLPNGKTDSPLDSDITLFEYDNRRNYLATSKAKIRADVLEKYESREGLLTRIIEPGNRITNILAYDGARKPRLIQLPNGIKLGFEYDTYGRLLKRSMGDISEYLVYNALGELASVRQSTGQTVNFAYGADGRVNAIFDAQNNKIQINRDTEGGLLGRYLLNPDGSIAQHTDLSRIVADPEAPANATQSTAANGLPDSLVTLDNATTHFTYDRMRKLSGFTDARGARSKFMHDDFGRLVKASSPDSGTTVFRYNAADHLISKTSGFGTTQPNTIEYHHDVAGRVIGQNTSEGMTTIRYGAVGRPVKIIFPEGEEHYVYDRAAQLISHTRIIDNHHFTTRYAYNERGQLKQKTLPDGQVLRYRYHDAMHAKAGLLAGIARQDLFGQTVLLDGFNDAQDSFTRQNYQLANGTDFVRELKPSGETARIGSPEFWEENHQRDAAGRLTLRGPVGDGVTRTAYSYDRIGRLNGVARMGKDPGVQGYAYDGGGNLLDRLAGTTHTRYQIASASNRILTAQVDGRSTPYFYNAAGSITRVGETIYTWDSHQRLRTVESAGRRLAAYTYNVFGERIKKVVYAHNQSVVTYYLYDGTQLVAEAKPNEGAIAITRQYVWLEDTFGARPIALLQRNGASVNSRALQAVPDDITRAGARALQNDVFAIVVDHTGAPRVLVDEHKRAVWRAEINGYGEAIPRGDNRIGLHLRGSNQYFDEETGLHYNYRRYLDPAIGRYLSADPIGLAGGSNPYVFSDNNPIDRIDPLGLQAKPTAPISSWSIEEKLKYVIERVADQYPGELGAALKELVSPAALATTAAIFGIWGAAQFTPYGWVADIGMAGIGFLFLGAAVWDVISGIAKSSLLISDAKCESDLKEAGDILAKGLGSAVAAAGTSGVFGGASKISKLVKLIFKDSVVAQKSATAAAITQTWFGKFVPGRSRSGSTANADHLTRQPGAYPPWSMHAVTEGWLNPGTKIYMINLKNATGPGGWATSKRFTSLADARKELALLEEFKQPGPNCCVLQEYIVKAPIPMREGFAGSLTSAKPPYDSYPGGAPQWELLLDRSLNWRNYLVPTPNPKTL